MKIKFDKIKNELLRHVIIHGISTNKKKGDELIAETHKNGGRVDLELKLNGFELPILSWFNRLDRDIDRMVEKKAHEMVTEKLNDVESEFYEIIQEARDKILNK